MVYELSRVLPRESADNVNTQIVPRRVESEWVRKCRCRVPHEIAEGGVMRARRTVNALTTLYRVWSIEENGEKREEICAHFLRQVLNLSGRWCPSF